MSLDEKDLMTFDGWLRFQGIDQASLAADELNSWRQSFDEGRNRDSETPKVGLMKLGPIPAGEFRYAIAVDDGSGLWLAAWVRCSAKGEFFAMVPRADREWDIHASYHSDGTSHLKGHDRRIFPTKRQPTSTLKGNEPLATFAGYAPKTVGAICNPKAFSHVIVIPTGILGPVDGQITVDLVEPGCQPAPFPWTKVSHRKLYYDTTPNVVITIGSCGSTT